MKKQATKPADTTMSPFHDEATDTRTAKAVFRQHNAQHRRMEAILACNEVDENGECDVLWMPSKK